MQLNGGPIKNMKRRKYGSLSDKECHEDAKTMIGVDSPNVDEGKKVYEKSKDSEDK